MKPFHCLAHYLGRALQIPLRVGDVYMAEVGGQQGQSSLGILTGPVPLHEGVCRETVAYVVQTRVPTVGWASQTDLPRQRIEGSMNVSLIQTIAPAGDEQIGGHRSPCPMSLTSGDVVSKHCAGRCMQRYQASLAELGAADRQYRRLQVGILKLEVACFTET